MTSLFPEMNGDAIVEGPYRYTLTRTTGVDSTRKLGLLGQNPSQAGAEGNLGLEDNTSRKWKTYARLWGFGSYTAVNVFAYRSTDPRQLSKLERQNVNVCGLQNRAHLERVAKEVDMFVVACGTPPWKRGETLAWATIDFLQTICDLYAVKVTGGLPHHLLYTPLSLTPFLWRPKDACPSCNKPRAADWPGGLVCDRPMEHADAGIRP